MPEVRPIEAHQGKLSPGVRELMQVAGFQHRKQIVDQLLSEMGENSA